MEEFSELLKPGTVVLDSQNRPVALPASCDARKHGHPARNRADRLIRPPMVPGLYRTDPVSGLGNFNRGVATGRTKGGWSAPAFFAITGGTDELNGSEGNSVFRAEVSVPPAGTIDFALTCRDTADSLLSFPEQGDNDEYSASAGHVGPFQVSRQPKEKRTGFAIV